MNNASIETAYRQLETRMRALAEADGDVYVPNPEPIGPVDYIFIAMEPSLGGWATTRVEAERKLADGFRNFLAGYDPLILHFSIRRFLLRSDQRYHITDFSKGAMLVALASTARRQRYRRWYPLLREETDLLSKDTVQVFAVGKQVDHHLRAMQFPRYVTPILHYSPRANRANGIAGHEPELEELRSTISHADLLALAHELINESNVPEIIRRFVLTKVEHRTLTTSRLKLMLNYKLSFEPIRNNPPR